MIETDDITMAFGGLKTALEKSIGQQKQIIPLKGVLDEIAAALAELMESRPKDVAQVVEAIRAIKMREPPTAANPQITLSPQITVEATMPQAPQPAFSVAVDNGQAIGSEWEITTVNVRNGERVTTVRRTK